MLELELELELQDQGARVAGFWGGPCPCLEKATFSLPAQMVLPPRMCVRRPDQNLSLSCPARPPPMMTFTTPQVQSSSRSNIFLLGGMSVINAAHFLRRNQQKQSSSTACHLPIAQVSPPPLAITMKPAEIITV